MRRADHRRVAFGLAAISTMLFSAPGSAAPPEYQPVTISCATNAFVQPLSAGTPAGVEGKSLVLVRVKFEPGGGIGPHTHPGTLAQTIESGQLGFTLLEEGEMTMSRSGEAGTPTVEETIPVGEEVVLGPGDTFVETGMVHTGRTVGDEPVVLLYAGLFAAGEPLTTCVEGTPTP
jgi:quercetin dioxygenase-like cupin family protein